MERKAGAKVMIQTCIGKRRSAGRTERRVRTAIFMGERERADVGLSVSVCSDALWFFMIVGCLEEREAPPTLKL